MPVPLRPLASIDPDLLDIALTNDKAHPKSFSPNGELNTAQAAEARGVSAISPRPRYHCSATEEILPPTGTRKPILRSQPHLVRLANLRDPRLLVSPSRPEAMDWSSLYPTFVDLGSTSMELEQPQPPRLSRDVTIADIGSGFGGLLISLSPQMPEELILGLELRTQVVEYVQDRIKALRNQNPGTKIYQNVANIRANTMKFLPNYFKKSQLKKIFFCFPDPHFKARKHKARIVSTTLNSEYAYVLQPGGIIYTITDVENLHNWMVEHFSVHPSFGRLSEAEIEGDPCVKATSDTEEAKKVERNNGPKFIACFKRLEDPPWPGE